MEEQQKEIKKGRKTFWLVVGIVLLMSYLVLLSALIFLQWGQGQRYYLDGFNGTFEGLARDVYSFFVWLITLPIFVFSLIYACFLKSMFKSHSKIRHLKIVFLVLLILLNPIFTFSSIYRLINKAKNPSSYERFNEGYRDWTKSALDIQEIRDWMGEQDEGVTCIGSEDFQGPKCFADNYKRLRHGMIFDEEGWRVLRIMSGGGFQDWGIVIGPEGMEVPESEKYKYHESASEYRLKLADGAYVYYELQ